MTTGVPSARDRLRFLTAGSVDDGKSTLIGRLLYDADLLFDDQVAAVRDASQQHGRTLDLSFVTDGLKAEREQGITIDVSYRYFATARRSFVVADAPGHEQYTRNMVTAASTSDLAIVLIDARRGVLPQTRRHSFIASLLGIRHLVVAVNKMDLVDYDEGVFAGIVEAYRAFASRLEIRDIRFVPVSALHGDNLVTPGTRMPWYRGETLLHVLETVHLASDANAIDFRLPVQSIVRMGGDGRGLRGTVASGTLRPGDEVAVLPSGRRSRVHSIVTFDGDLESAGPGLAVIVRLVDDVDVARGDMLVHPGNAPRLSDEFEAMLVWFDDEPLGAGRDLLLKHTTRLQPAAIHAVRYRMDVHTMRRRDDAGDLTMNDVARCTVRVARPLAIDPYRANRQTGAFILIDRLTNRTVAAGAIVDRAIIEDGVGEPSPVPDHADTREPVALHVIWVPAGPGQPPVVHITGKAPPAFIEALTRAGCRCVTAAPLAEFAG